MADASNNFELLDFGHGRRLERFGPWVLDRPAPGTENAAQAAPQLWQTADACYLADRAAAGEWEIRNHDLKESTVWQLAYDRFALSLKLSPSGQIGVFPEQRTNWDWIAKQVRAFQAEHNRAPRVLNLFAYTGGSTLAAAAAGAEVAHVDASGSVVGWARENAAASGLSDAPIRWLVEDAMRFVERELRRGNHYDGIILDPPTYGHGGGKRVWKIEQHLQELLSACAQLAEVCLSFLLLTAHTPEFDAGRLEQLVWRVFPSADQGEIASGRLAIVTRDVRRMSAGSFVRASKNPAE